jgi:hypothetical protein
MTARFDVADSGLRTVTYAYAMIFAFQSYNYYNSPFAQHSDTGILDYWRIVVFIVAPLLILALAGGRKRKRRPTL